MGYGEGRKKKKPAGEQTNIPGLTPSVPGASGGQQQQASAQQRQVEPENPKQQIKARDDAQTRDQHVQRQQQPAPAQQQQRGDSGEKPKYQQKAASAPPEQQFSPSRSASVSSSISSLSLESGKSSPKKGARSAGKGLMPPQKRLGDKPSFPGTKGRQVNLRVNHLPVKVPQGIIYQYSVNIKAPWQRPFKKVDRDIYHLVINKWRHTNVVAKKDPHTWVFDGHSTLYCPKAYEGIPDQEITIKVEDDREYTFEVKDIKIDTAIQIHQDLANWAAAGQSGGIPSSALSAINIILSQSRILNINYTNLDKTYFRNDGQVIDLGFGKECWSGIFSSVRPHSWDDRGTQFLLTLNANISNKV